MIDSCGSDTISKLQGPPEIRNTEPLDDDDHAACLAVVGKYFRCGQCGLEGLACG